jgi:hypothetical protein
VIGGQQREQQPVVDLGVNSAERVPARGQHVAVAAR